MSRYDLGLVCFGIGLWCCLSNLSNQEFSLVGFPEKIFRALFFHLSPISIWHVCEYGGSFMGWSVLFSKVRVFFILLFTLSLFPPVSAETQRQIKSANSAPIAHISTTSPQAVHVGRVVSLSATGSSDPESQTLFYEWSFVEKPDFSGASLSTPSPSQPSFQVDQEGFYVVRLRVSDGLALSEPKFLVISAVTPTGKITLEGQDYRNPFICSVSRGLIGCVEETRSFMATAGEYILNITNNSAERLFITLNSEPLGLPSDWVRGLSIFRFL